MLATILLLSVHFFDSGWVEATPNTHAWDYMHANWTVCDLPPVPNEAVAVSLTVTYEMATTLHFENPYPFPMVRGNLGVGWAGYFAGHPGVMYPTLSGLGSYSSAWDYPMYVPAYGSADVPWSSGTYGPFTGCYGESAVACGDPSMVSTSLTPFETDGSIYFAPATVSYVDSLAWLTNDGRRWLTFQSESCPLFTVRNYTRATGFARYLDANGVEL